MCSHTKNTIRQAKSQVTALDAWLGEGRSRTGADIEYRARQNDQARAINGGKLGT